jgi:hypothetical protein
MTSCKHCERPIELTEAGWIDPEATGDDSIWRETCDRNEEDRMAQHEPAPKVYTYGAIWRGMQAEIEAPTTFAAQTKAVEMFQAVAGRRKVKAHEVTVMLMSINGEPYVHVAS